MELKKIVPTYSRFYLRLVDKHFTMNPINLADEEWLKEAFGQTIGDIFINQDMISIVRVVYRLLDSESRAFFVEQEVDFMDESGKKQEKTIGGVELLKSLISGDDEKAGLVNALIDNLGMSRPDIDPDESEDDKKKGLN